jgi:hypothetical protein
VTQQSHHRMENRYVAAARYQSCGLMGQDLGPWHCESTADECMSSTVLRDVLTLFQNGGGFDIFILKVLQNTSLLKVHSLDKEVDGIRKTETCSEKNPIYVRSFVRCVVV